MMDETKTLKIKKIKSLKKRNKKKQGRETTKLENDVVQPPLGSS
jgi:hypothetical protein